MLSHDALSRFSLRSEVWLAIVLGLTVAAGASLAQETSSIIGVVYDHTGAIVPGQEVELASVSRGTVIRTKTNADGVYSFVALPPGTYSLSVGAQGFKRYDLKEIVLGVGQQVRVDPTRTIGETQTSVTVEGSSGGQVDTASSEISGVVTGKQISQ